MGDRYLVPRLHRLGNSHRSATLDEHPNPDPSQGGQGQVGQGNRPIRGQGQALPEDHPEADRGGQLPRPALEIIQFLRNTNRP